MQEKREKKSGKKEGEKSGKMKEKIEIAKAMIKKNTDINFISEVTGLSKEKIEKISCATLN